MSLASSLRKASNKVLNAVGGDVTIRTVTPGSYNTTTGVISESTSDATVKGLVEDINKREVNELIQADDRRLTIAALSVNSAPTTTDRVVISSVAYQIISVKTVAQDNTAVTYELILRA